MKHFFLFPRVCTRVGLSFLTLLIVATVVLSICSAQAATTRTSVIEHYNGKTYTLSPGNWHGATNCAIVTPTDAYCFDTDAEFASFTNSDPATGPMATSSVTSDATAAATGTCNGWAKIWNGTNFTNRGLAFHNYGNQQYLGDYVTVPFNVRSWFTDGQRGYEPMTNCYAYVNDPQFIELHTNAHSLNTGGRQVSFIELFHGVD
jgi:hypothetical protein